MVQLLTFFVIFTSSKHSVLSVAIYSFSLGCKCIFLLGGKTRDEVPTAMFLHSGDIVLMAGEARECFHGILRYEIKVICK
jgi:alkylated DNA repair dioxygenase AlkB